MEQGQLALVLDALDEAQARAGDDNFAAFLQDIIEFGPMQARQPVLACLAEPTADRVAAIIGSRGVKFVRVEVDYFDEAAALRFISKYLDSVHPDAAAPHQRHKQPFERAKELILEFLRAAISSAGWNETVPRSLLGYAPVLQGISLFLDTDNFYELASRFVARDARSNSSATRSPWAILPQIVERLLAREHDKLVAAAQGNFGDLAKQAQFAAWTELYTAGEQLRLVSQFVMDPGRIAKPSCLPDSLYASYCEVLDWLLPQHPFIGHDGDYANVLFSEYVRAWLLCQRARGLSESLSYDNERRHFDSSYLPSPLLGHLSLLVQNPMPPTTEDEFQEASAADRPLIPPEYVGVWFESFLSVRGSTQPALEISPWDESGRGIGLVRDPLLGAVYFFWVKGEESSLVFRRTLRFADIDTYGGVYFGGSGPTVRLGPDVRILAEWLEFACREVRVYQGSGVTLRASLLEPGKFRTPTVKLIGEGDFDCWWPEMKYPWLAFKPATDHSELDEETREKIRQRLVMFLQSIRRVDWLKDKSQRHDESLRTHGLSTLQLLLAE